MCQGPGDIHIQHKESIRDNSGSIRANGHVPMSGGLGWNRLPSSAPNQLMTEQNLTSSAEPTECCLVDQADLRGPETPVLYSKHL